MEHYHYIIVGAGSAGCVLANRLTEDVNTRVLLVEAGKTARNPLYDFPMFAGHLYRQKPNNWFYSTEEQPHLNGRKIFMPRGKMIGGSFIFNGMVYIRGQSQDYDHWAQLGNRGWSFAEVLPYFRRSEAYEEGENAYHGGDGPLVVNHARSANPLFQAFVEAGVEAGYPLNRDFNGPSQSGFGRFDFTIKRGRRWNTASAFLKPALKRPNLRVISEALVSRVLFEGRRAVGIEFGRGGSVTRAGAHREVILSGGAINTPQILLLSGIGPADDLRRQGIPLLHDLPGVGRNLQDHVDVNIAYVCKAPVSLMRALRLDRFLVHFMRAIAMRQGPVSDSAIEAGCFLGLTPGGDTPDVQAHFMPISSNGARLYLPFARPPADPSRGPSFAVRIGPTRPESRGHVRLKSRDPEQAPAIQPMYFSAERDLWLARESVKTMRHVIAQPAFDRFRGIEIAPGPDCRSDDAIEAYCREVATTVHHPVGTAKMGSDQAAVVDDRLQVRGIERLRVVDASVMPTLVSGNTNAPTIMIAEKAADLIRNRGAPAPAQV